MDLRSSADSHRRSTAQPAEILDTANLQNTIISMANIFPFRGHTPRIHPTAWVAPTATIIGNVVVEEHASIWFGAVIRGDDPDHEIRIGARTSIQDNCVVHVSARGPTLVGAGVTVGHGAVLESCTIGDGALIGMNAVILQDATVGAAALIAAGSVVASGASIADRHLAAGAPAREKKELEGESLGWVLHSADHYVELGSRYRESFAGSDTPKTPPAAS